MSTQRRRKSSIETFQLAMNPPNKVQVKGLKANETKHIRQGDLCPQCKIGKLDYDGLLNLSCPECNFIQGGACT